MKKLMKICLVIGTVLFAGNSLSAQNFATADAIATIVTPIAITNVTDLNFGNVAVDATPGTVAMAPATAVRTPGGGCTLPSTTGTVTAAEFTVTGEAGYTYSITLPAGVTTLTNGAAATMTVDTWTSSPASPGTIGAGNLFVAGTLHVGASQTPGLYQATFVGGTGEFTVTVNYN